MPSPGTWGKATSVLAHGVTPKNKLIKELLEPHLHGIHSNGNLMANYIVKYFNNMYDHAAQIAKVCRKRARLAYVIGNSNSTNNRCPATKSSRPSLHTSALSWNESTECGSGDQDGAA